MIVAITGSRGFVGTKLVQSLRRLELEIIEIDLALGHDLTKWDTLSKVGYFDVLIHLAARTFVPESFVHPASFYETNVTGSLHALELCRKYESKIIFTSSYVYGSPKYIPINELHPLNATNPYAQSKILGEELCHAYHRDFDIPAIIFRPFNAYGKGQNDNFLIPSIIKQAYSGKVMLKDPRPRRDFIFIDDLVDAYTKAINADFSKVEIFNLGSGISTSIQELAQLITENMRMDFSVVFSNEQRKNEILETRADISKSRKLLKWNPGISMEKGISMILR